MLQKMQDFCDLSPRKNNLQTSLDLLARNIFDPPSDYKQYVSSSTALPDSIYGIEFDEKSIKHVSNEIKNFSKFGPNEKFIINRIRFSPFHLLLMVGGIGVGKTSFFTKFFLKEMPHETIHSQGQNNSMCPFYIYLDVLSDTNIIQPNKDIKTNYVKSRFSDLLCNLIEQKINDLGLFNIEEEMTLVWDFILLKESKNLYSNACFAKISQLIRNKKAEIKDKIGEDYKKCLAIRQNIKSEIYQDTEYRISYIESILAYIKERYYKDHPNCLLVIIDNVDRLEIQSQQAIKLALKPFARNSGLKTILPIRQTTFDQSFGGDYHSEPVDCFPFCGATPLEVIIDRLKCFLESNSEQYTYIPPEDFLVIKKAIEKILKEVILKPWFKTYFDSLVGRSVRRGQVIARNIINNSIFEIKEFGADDKSIPKHTQIVRSLLVGPYAAYKWRDDDEAIVENIFETQSLSGYSNLIKLRILRMLLIRYYRDAKEEGLLIGDLLSDLDGFNYTIDLIFKTLNELLSKPKRLIWTDAVPAFESEKDLICHQNSKVRITSAGRGYAKYLYKDMDYIQEIMLDVYCDPEYFGEAKGYLWKYGRNKNDRFILVYKFCHMLLNKDIEETKIYLSKHGKERFRKIFDQNALLVDEIIRSARTAIENIQRNTEDENYVRFLKEEMARNYESLLSKLDNFNQNLIYNQWC